ncbi:class D sortase [Clostridium sp.]|uniref:class D sortase n=1 Tax=Clostridium sp. TaxID=1506 RepID=UPI003F323DB1
MTKYKKGKISSKRLAKKLGITFVIPIFMLLCGAIIFFSATWDMVTGAMTMGSVLFSKPNDVNIGEVQYIIDNKAVYRPSIGENFATLKIEALGFEKPIIHGDSYNELNQGIGHYAGSTIPGEGGNVIISGHRDRVFLPIQNIEVGHELVIETNYGKYKYKVSEIKIVDQSQNEDLAPLDYERLTMYTCYPFDAIGNTSERMIMICEYIGNV